MNALLILIPLLTLSPAAIGDNEPKDQPNVHGIWKVTAMETRGTPYPLDRLGVADRYTLVIAGEGYVLNTHAGTLKVDPAQHHIDLTITEGRYKGTVLQGIYELTGDTLKLAFHSPAQRVERPKQFKDATSTHMSYTFARDDKATKEQVEAKLKELTGGLANQGAGRFGQPSPTAQTQEMLKQILERLDRIDRRLDAMEKKGNPSEKK